jgi:hypothetical protein
LRANLVYEGALVDVSAVLAVEAAGVIFERRKVEERSRCGEGGLLTPSMLGIEFVERLRGARASIGVETLP